MGKKNVTPPRKLTWHSSDKSRPRRINLTGTVVNNGWHGGRTPGWYLSNLFSNATESSNTRQYSLVVRWKTTHCVEVKGVEATMDGVVAWDEWRKWPGNNPCKNMIWIKLGCEATVERRWWGWYIKDEEWCKDHEVQIPRNSESHVDNR